MTKGPAVAELTWPQVHAFRLHRHHLTARAPRQELAGVVGEMGGAQAQVMSAAELQIAVRTECKVSDVREALWTDRTLVKSWLMRGTLHLACSDDLPVYTAAMSHHARVRPSWLNYMQLSELEFRQLRQEIGATLNGQPLTREELIAAVAEGKSAHVRQLLKSGWGSMLKPAARAGLLCFGPSRGQSVTFVSPRKWLPGWRDANPDSAIVEVARRYLRAYGPATKSDFARWWGAWPRAGRAAWSGLGPELVSVSVDGQRMDLLATDLAAIQRASLVEQVQLLPQFDPYLMGHAKRDHLFDRAHAPKVSRTAGWISAVLLVGGRVEGTWMHSLARNVLRIRIEPFRRPTPGVMAGVRDRAAELGAALGASDTDVKVAQAAR